LHKELISYIKRCIMTTETQNPNPEAATVEGLGSEEAAIRALSQLENSQQTAEPQSKPDDDETQDEAAEDEPKDDPEGEADEAEPKKGELVEVEYEGKLYEVPPVIEKALLRQSDYSRKMNEASETEKTAKVRIEQADKLIDGAEKFAEVLAEVNGIDAQIARFEKVDWASLRQSEPAEYAALQADLRGLQADRAASVQKAQGIDSELSTIRQTQNAEKRNLMVKELQKNLKGWGDDLGAKITQYAIETGYTAQDLQQVTDSKWVIAMNKARKYDALQKDKVAIKAQVKDLPNVVKPGSPRRADPSADVSTRFIKTRSDDDAIALLEAKFRK
jgi:hypothetical protein